MEVSPSSSSSDENLALRRQIESLQRELEAVRTKKEWMERTFSWQVTTPLRLMRKWIQQRRRKAGSPSSPPPRGRPKDPVRALRFLIDLPPAQSLTPPAGPLNRASLHLHWIVPDFRPGAGGHMVIFKMMYHLQERGHRHTLWIMHPNQHKQPGEVITTLHEHFFPLNPDVKLLDRDSLTDLQGDALIATDRWTTYYARAAAGVRAKFYFVQDFEPVFYPLGAEYLLTENTYHFGFQFIASSPWLKKKLHELGQNEVTTIDYAYDPTRYFLDEKVRRHEKTIVFYSRGATPRRAVELGFLALSLLYRIRQDVRIIFFGDHPKPYLLDFPYEDRGILSHRELGELYREATLGLVFSATNISLIPKEMMACGLPVIDLERENTVSSLPEGCASLVRPDPHAIAERIHSLLDDAATRQALAERALSYVQTLSWDKAGNVFHEALQKGIPD